MERGKEYNGRKGGGEERWSGEEEGVQGKERKVGRRRKKGGGKGREGRQRRERREEIEVSGQRQMKTRTSQICTAYFHRMGCELDIEFTNLHFSFIKHSNQVPWNEVSKTLQSLEEDI